MGIISFFEGERFMKKNLAIAVIAIASLYLLTCVCVFIPKREFSEVAAEVMISVVILLIGGSCFLLTCVVAREKKQALMPYSGRGS